MCVKVVFWSGVFLDTDTSINRPTVLAQHLRSARNCSNYKEELVKSFAHSLDSWLQTAHAAAVPCIIHASFPALLYFNIFIYFLYIIHTHREGRGDSGLNRCKRNLGMWVHAHTRQSRGRPHARRAIDVPMANWHVSCLATVDAEVLDKSHANKIYAKR